MFITKKSLDRRTFLRGAGKAILALPLLEAMVPALTAWDKREFEKVDLLPWQEWIFTDLFTLLI